MLLVILSILYYLLIFGITFKIYKFWRSYIS